MKLELTHPFLADENEREEAAKHFTTQFTDNSVKSLKFIVGPLKDPSVANKIDEYIKFKLKVKSSAVEDKGFLFKKKVMSHLLEPETINHKNMLNIADAFYDLILAFDVAVNVEESDD